MGHMFKEDEGRDYILSVKLPKLLDNQLTRRMQSNNEDLNRLGYLTL